VDELEGANRLPFSQLFEPMGGPCEFGLLAQTRRRAGPETSASIVRVSDWKEGEDYDFFFLKTPKRERMTRMSSAPAVAAGASAAG